MEDYNDFFEMFQSIIGQEDAAIDTDNDYVPYCWKRVRSLLSSNDKKANKKKQVSI